jgi:hypothetical protein
MFKRSRLESVGISHERFSSDSLEFLFIDLCEISSEKSTRILHGIIQPQPQSSMNLKTKVIPSDHKI